MGWEHTGPLWLGKYSPGSLCPQGSHFPWVGLLCSTLGWVFFSVGQNIMMIPLSQDHGDISPKYDFNMSTSRCAQGSGRSTGLVFLEGSLSLGTDGSSVLWFILPASLMKSMYLLMIICNQNSMNKVVNSPNKRQCLHQQNPQADTGVGSVLPGDCLTGPALLPNASRAVSWCFRRAQTSPS